MRWFRTPSIGPDGDDQNVYLVVDDFGRNRRAYRETDVENADLETVIIDLLDGQYKTRSSSSDSTPRRVGLSTSRPTLPMNCAGAAICSYAISPQASRISSSAMPDMWTGS
jgi:hypothetical protein